MMAILTAFRAAPPARQLLLIAGLVAIVGALLAAAYFAWFRTRYEPLYDNLRAADAATIVAELDRTHADYRIADGGRTILVPAGAVDSTRLRIAGQDLPLQGTVGFELFNSSSIGLTEFAQRINLQRALQGELARTIMAIDGVESARVHLSLGEQSIFRGDRRPARASVAVRTQPGRRLSSAEVRGIQRLVGGAVPDLEADNVAVLNDRGVVVSGDAPDDAPVAPGTEEERNVERFFEMRIRRAVEARYPADSIEVNVWAALGERRNAQPPGTGTPLSEEAMTSGRDFRLRATVAVASAMPEAARERITQAVREAMGFDDALGDTLSVTASPPVPATSDWSESAADPGPDANLVHEAAPRPQGSWFDGLWTPLLVLALIVGLLLVARGRRSAPEPLSAQQRLAYAANLRTLLAQREADASQAA